MADNHGHAAIRQPAGHLHGVEHHGFARHGMQHFGELGVHALALTGRHDDDAQAGNTGLRGCSTGHRVIGTNSMRTS
jgi:hypothetical protein